MWVDKVGNLLGKVLQTNQKMFVPRMIINGWTAIISNKKDMVNVVSTKLLPIPDNRYERNDPIPAQVLLTTSCVILTSASDSMSSFDDDGISTSVCGWAHETRPMVPNRRCTRGLKSADTVESWIDLLHSLWLEVMGSYNTGTFTGRQIHQALEVMALSNSAGWRCRKYGYASRVLTRCVKRPSRNNTRSKRCP